MIKDYGVNNPEAWATGECQYSPDGKHHFISETIGKCYTKKRCIYCGSVVKIDSSD